MKKFIGAVALALSIIGSSSQAAIIAGWDFDPQLSGNGVWGPSPYDAATSAANVSVGGLTRGAGVDTPAGSSGAANAWGGTNWQNTDLATAIAGGDFIFFTIAPTAGFAVSLDSIDPYNIRRSGTGASTGLWQYQIGGGAWNDIGSAITWGGTTSNVGNSKPLIDLSGIAALQDVTSAIGIRLVNWGGTSAGGTWYFNDPLSPTGGSPANDLTVSGSVAAAAVPEPTSMAVLSIAGVTAGVGAWHRRKANKAQAQA